MSKVLKYHILTSTFYDLFAKYSYFADKYSVH